MQRKHISLTLAAACAALFAGCEWGSTSENASWSGSYDAMNFGGTYRITTVNQTGESNGSGSGNEANWETKEEGGGTFQAGATGLSGRTAFQNVVPGSVKVSCGSYVWVDNGSGVLVFSGNSSSGSGGSSDKVYNGRDSIGKLTLDQSYTHQISVMASGPSDVEIVPGSVSVSIGGAVAFQDNGSGTLVANGVLGSGTINYQSGVISFGLDSAAMAGKAAYVAYQYKSASGVNPDGSAVLSGSGSILYPSGSWSISVSPKMPSTQKVTVTYSYYTEKSGTSYTGIDTKNYDPSYVTSVTVSQTGQNLTLRLNNGIVMSGRFTTVRKTASQNTDTGAGADTYNAQFEVSSGDSKMVGTLNYDYPTHNRILDGTWTWGRKVFDVHATGPAWTESGVTTAAESTVTTGK